MSKKHVTSECTVLLVVYSLNRETVYDHEV